MNAPRGHSDKKTGEAPPPAKLTFHVMLPTTDPNALKEAFKTQLVDEVATAFASQLMSNPGFLSLRGAQTPWEVAITVATGSVSLMEVRSCSTRYLQDFKFNPLVPSPDDPQGRYRFRS